VCGVSWLATKDLQPTISVLKCPTLMFWVPVNLGWGVLSLNFYFLLVCFPRYGCECNDPLPGTRLRFPDISDTPKSLQLDSSLDSAL
jgi:hypothetical protein